MLIWSGPAMAAYSVPTLPGGQDNPVVLSGVANVTGQVTFTVTLENDTGSDGELDWTVSLPADPEWHQCNEKIKIEYLFGNVGSVYATGIQMYTDNKNGTVYDYTGDASNPAGLVGATNSGHYLPCAWRVVDNVSDLTNTIYENVINENNFEKTNTCAASAHGAVYDAEAGVYRIDINEDGQLTSDVVFNVNGGNLSWISLLSNLPYADLQREDNGPGPGDNGVGFYASYIWMLDKYQGDPAKTPMEETGGPYLPPHETACYATIVNAVNGIQHAENKFSNDPGGYIAGSPIYVKIGANFKDAQSQNYGTDTLTLEMYAL